MNTRYAIDIEDLTVAYGDTPVVWDVDLKIPQGIMMCIAGPNGAGKSTLLKAALGLVKPAAGRALFNGKPYKENRSAVAYVPQRGSVDWDFPINAFDVALMGLYGTLGLIKRPGKKERARALRALEEVGMEDLMHRQIGHLSGGQQQRVFLARALAQDAEIYCMDEPFQGVDVTTEKAIIAILQTLRKNGKTVVVVHHDLQTAKEYFDWALLMNVRAIASGPIETTFTEENLKKAFGGKIGFLVPHTHETPEDAEFGERLE